MPENPANPHKLRLTALKTANGKAIRKVVEQTPEGQIVAVSNYPKISYWTRDQSEIPLDIDALGDFISQLATRPDCCLVTGEPIGDAGLDAKVTRWKYARPGEGQATLGECSAAWVPVDMDGIHTGIPLDPSEPEIAIAAAVDQLGDPFRSASYVWQLTSQATPGSDRIRCRVYFLVDTDISNDQRRAWAKNIIQHTGIKLVDLSPFTCNQPIYTATPSFHKSTDPFVRRIGVTHGEYELVPWAEVPTLKAEPGQQYQGTRAGGPIPAGIDERLARVGDGAGQEGFDAPIYESLVAMVRAKWTTDRIISAIQRTVSATTVDPTKHSAQYLRAKTDPTNLKRQIRNAERFLQAEENPPRVTQTRMIDDAIPVEEASALIYDKVSAWVRGEGPDMLVLDVTVGTGKTTQAVQAIKANLKAGSTLLWGFPTHNQGAEVLEKFNADRPMAVKIEGRVRDAKGDPSATPLCHRPHIIKAIDDAGLSKYTSTIACESKTSEGHQVCPHWHGCQYYRQFLGNHSIRLFTHDYLSLAKSRVFSGPFMEKSIGLVIDESPLERMVGRKAHSLGDVLIAGGALAEVLQMFRDGADIPADMSERLKAEMEERCTPNVPMNGPHASNEWALMAELRSMAGVSRPRFTSIYSAAIARLDGDINSLWFGRDKEGNDLVLSAWRHSLPEGVNRALVLDGTADHETYRALLGDSVEIVRINVEQNVEITQARDIPLGKKHLTDPENHGALAQAVALARSMGAGLITNKAGIELAQAKGYLPKDHPVGHFNNLRGMNSMESLDALVIAGRPEPDARSIEAIARALWPRESMELTGSYVWRSDGVASVASHPDSRCDGLLRIHREAELSQSIGRLRAVWAKKTKRVIVLTHTPIGLPVISKPFADIVLPAPLARLLLAGNGVAPLVPAIMASMLPDTWATPEAAKLWGKRNLKGSLSLSNTLHKENDPFKFRVKGQKRQSWAVSWLELEDVWEQLERITGRQVVDCQRTGEPRPTWTKPAFTVIPHQFKTVDQAPVQPLIWEKPTFTIKHIGTGAMLPVITRLRRLWEDIIDAAPDPHIEFEPALIGGAA
jgi:hypothetical protein